MKLLEPPLLLGVKGLLLPLPPLDDAEQNCGLLSAVQNASSTSWENFNGLKDWTSPDEGLGTAWRTVEPFDVVKLWLYWSADKERWEGWKRFLRLGVICGFPESISRILSSSMGPVPGEGAWWSHVLLSIPCSDQLKDKCATSWSAISLPLVFDPVLCKCRKQVHKCKVRILTVE
jgi:hypothetical protein